ncbi:MAG: DUF1367 family protein [Rikenellaceae bacterium]|nr:DUF1367 family protein [Rikenellaceae bacterium]MBR6630638.1 DUF1367 family protein [Alistipes sp.]
MDIYCRVTEQGLVPMYDSDLEEKRRLKIGDTVLCKISRPRNYEFHKKFFALVRLTYENLPERLHYMLSIWSEEDLLTCLKLDLGLATTVYHGGKEFIKTGSISFAAMDNSEFENFYQRTIDVILNKYLRGTDKQALLEEIVNFK